MRAIQKFLARLPFCFLASTMAVKSCTSIKNVPTKPTAQTLISNAFAYTGPMWLHSIEMAASAQATRTFAAGRGEAYTRSRGCPDADTTSIHTANPSGPSLATLQYERDEHTMLPDEWFDCEPDSNDEDAQLDYDWLKEDYRDSALLLLPDR